MIQYSSARYEVESGDIKLDSGVRGEYDQLKWLLETLETKLDNLDNSRTHLSLLDPWILSPATAFAYWLPVSGKTTAQHKTDNNLSEQSKPNLLHGGYEPVMSPLCLTNNSYSRHEWISRKFTKGLLLRLRVGWPAAIRPTVYRRHPVPYLGRWTKRQTANDSGRWLQPTAVLLMVN